MNFHATVKIYVTYMILRVHISRHACFLDQISYDWKLIVMHSLIQKTTPSLWYIRMDTTISQNIYGLDFRHMYAGCLRYPSHLHRLLPSQLNIPRWEGGHQLWHHIMVYIHPTNDERAIHPNANENSYTWIYKCCGYLHIPPCSHQLDLPQLNIAQWEIRRYTLPCVME